MKLFLRMLLAVLLVLALFLTSACSASTAATETATGEPLLTTQELSAEEKAAADQKAARDFSAKYLAGAYADEMLYQYSLGEYIALPDLSVLDFPETDDIRAEATEEEARNYLRIVEIQNLVEQSEYTEIPSGTLQKWDVVTVDFRGEMDGEEFSGGSAENYTILIGSESLIAGFEEGLIGKTIGQEVALHLTFPVYYQNEICAGRDVIFYVTIRSAKRPPEAKATLAEFNELFQTSFEDDAALLNAVLEDLSQYRAANRETVVTNYLFRSTKAKSAFFSLPEKELSLRKEYFINYHRNYIGEGQTLEENCKDVFGITYEELLSAAEEAAKDTVESEIFILALMAHYQIVPTEEQLAAYVMGEYENNGSQYFTDVSSFVTAVLEQEGVDYFYLQLASAMVQQHLYGLAASE